MYKLNTFGLTSDFPLFQHHAKLGQRLVYLDNAATMQVPEAVIKAITQFYATSKANVHRGLYPLAEQVTKDYEQVRADVAAFIGAGHADQIVFTKGTTEAINLFAQAWGYGAINQSSTIVVTQAEHHANLIPWQELARRSHARLIVLPINPQNFTFDNAVSLLPDNVTLLAITHDSNVLGPVWGQHDQNLHALIAAAKQRGAVVLLDAAQSIAHAGLHVGQLDVDAAVFSGHKMYGPTGVGVLFVHRRLHEQLHPYQFGGGMVHSVGQYQSTYARMPQLLEAGTPPIASVLGLGAACDYLGGIDRSALVAYEAQLCARLLDGLRQDTRIIVLGDQDVLAVRGHMVSFTVPGVHGHDIAAFCGAQGVAMRAGHHCAQPLAAALGYESLVRMSIGMYNTVQDIDYAVQCVRKAIDLLINL